MRRKEACNFRAFFQEVCILCLPGSLYFPREYDRHAITEADRCPGHFSVNPFKFLPPLFESLKPWQQSTNLPLREIGFLARLRLLIIPLVNKVRKKQMESYEVTSQSTNKMSDPQQMTRPSAGSVL